MGHWQKDREFIEELCKWDRPVMWIPYVVSPFTAVTAVVPSLQLVRQCGVMEMRLAHCLEANGHDALRTTCRLLHTDLLQCTHPIKSHERVKLMRQERARQYKNKQRKTLHEKPPPFDAFPADIQEK